MSAKPIAYCARLVNLVIPGGGLILIGSEITGTLVAVLFTAAACFSLGTSLAFPDDVSATWRGLGIGVALGTYVGAQVRFAQTLRYERGRASDELRRVALRDARDALSVGRVEDAWRSLQPIVRRVEADLLLAYRVAQVLTARGDDVAALRAWRRVRRLDRHRIYRQEVNEQERALSGVGQSAGSSVPPPDAEA
jgi:hypothetical protein